MLPNPSSLTPETEMLSVEVAPSLTASTFVLEKVGTGFLIPEMLEVIILVAFPEQANEGAIGDGFVTIEVGVACKFTVTVSNEEHPFASIAHT